MLAGYGDGAVSVHLSDHSALNFQGAYSPAPGFGVIGSAYAVSEDNVHGLFVEGGAGLYRPVKRRLLFDTYGLFGLGHVNNDFSSANVKAYLLRYGVQPSIGFRSRYFDAAVSSHFVGLSYMKIRGNAVDEIQYLRDAGTQFLIEPAVTVRVGAPALKLQLQGGRSYNQTSRSFRQTRDIVSVGLVFEFGKN
jgi:hypothetical protein